VLIPAFDRTEMLMHCLDHLARCPEVRNVTIRVCIDRRAGHAPLNEFAAIQEWNKDLDVELRFTGPHMHHGNSFNVLTSLRHAYADSEFDLFYVVEDDVLVSPEFFTWHERIQRDVRPAASIGVRNPGHGAYASLGACLPRVTVEAILEHAVLAYFRDMRGYCRFAFPPSPFDCEQDGLIARVLAGRKVAWANPPIVSHVGWYGYHRKNNKRPDGRLEERYHQVREALADPVLLTALAGGRPDVVLSGETNHGVCTLSTVPGGAA